MQPTHFLKAGLMALFVTVIVMTCWELFLRHRGYPISYDDNDPLWADKRAMVYEPSDQALVFTGSSRIKFDLDLPTWDSLTGIHAIQLAQQGSDPRPYLFDLADDSSFHGNLVVDVTEGLFFSQFPFSSSGPRRRVAYYKKRTPTEKFGFQVNHVLESQFRFLDKDYFSLNALLERIPLPHRKGVFVDPYFPIDFNRTSFGRQSSMTPAFMKDTSLQNQVKNIWLFFESLGGPPPIAGKPLDSVLLTIKTATDKIKSRGGDVLFVRTPSSGHELDAEEKFYPRSAYWDRILEVTKCKGIYYADYPATAHYVCPEWSHLSPADAVLYTKELIKIIQSEKGWALHQPETH